MHERAEKARQELAEKLGPKVIVQRHLNMVSVTLRITNATEIDDESPEPISSARQGQLETVSRELLDRLGPL